METKGNYVLNPKRVSVLDIDTDISGIKRAQVLKHLYKVYGDYISNVATFKMEKSKSAIQTAARGLNIAVEDALYLSSLITVERGQCYTLNDMYYGDKEKGIAPNTTFIAEINKHKGLWEIASKIEGLVCGYGSHAGGIIFVDKPFTDVCALMRAPDGTLITQFDLHDDEKLSLIKIDLLSIEGIDKIQTCLELLIKAGLVKEKPTLRETYEDVIGIYKIERDDPKMWEMVWNHKILSLFQMEQQSGIQGIEQTHPASVDDLATLNSVIRLTIQEKGAETPVEKYARFRKHPEDWEHEMIEAGLTEAERNLLHKHLDTSSGLCIAQEVFMQLVQLPECGGFDLQWSDRLRRAIAKKNPKEFEKLEAEYFETVKEKHLSMNLCSYVWYHQISLSKGYGFNASHTLGYSLVALQEMNLAYKYPIIYWNTANLIIDSAGIYDKTDEDDEDVDEPTCVENEDGNPEEEEIVSLYEPEEWEEYEYEDLPDRSGKKKKKIKTVDYGRVASAIGKFQANGITIVPPDINTSGYTFTPDAEHNRIMYGLRGIARISPDLIEAIMKNRPFASLSQFLETVPSNKLQTLNLIKAGAFDEIEKRPREEIMRTFIETVAEKKNRLTLQNMAALLERDVIPAEMEWYGELFQFNKFLKKHKSGDYYTLTNGAITYIGEHFSADLIEDGNRIRQKTWDTTYSKAMEPMRAYIKSHSEEMLARLNQSYYDEIADKYAQGNVSHWEMESVSFYYHPHELAKVSFPFDDFNALPDTPTVEREFKMKNGQTVRKYRLSLLAGTVIDKNKMKTITLLTQTGVVTVKIYKNQFALYDKQISNKDEDGVKHVLERSWFSRGTLLLVQGFRSGEQFVLKKYRDSVFPVISRFESIDNDGQFMLKYEREVEEE